MQIGSHILEGNLVLAPMAGVTDEAYRAVCRDLGAAMTVGEMAASDAHLLDTEKTRRRFRCDPNDPVPVVQILGSDPMQMAEAAALAQECGARIVDVNFGCPARVVCGKACGSALMREPELAGRILAEVAKAVSVEVTVKMRLGWDEDCRTAVEIARMAQDCGFAAVTVHGRTRAQRFSGVVDKDGIAQVVKALSIPIVANGDVTTPKEAQEMLEKTGAAGVMIGRGAYGNPWLFERTKAFLETRTDPGMPSRSQAGRTVLEHFARHMKLWTQDGPLEDEVSALRSFRKHARWYMERYAEEKNAEDAQALYKIVRTQSAQECARVMTEFFNR